PMTEDKIFHIMSMTKPIITVAFMMLYEEGHFKLSDKLSKYLPEFENMKVALSTSEGLQQVETEKADSPILISQVLTHTAGMSHGLSGTKLDNEIAFALYYMPHPDIAGRVSKLAELPLVYHPGDRWHYSTAPDVLALLIEKFSGQTVEEFLRERLFDTQGMDDTGYNIPANKLDRQAFYHTRKPEEKQVKVAEQSAPVTGNVVYGGSFGLMSTAEDYLKFCRMLLNGGKWDGRRYLSRKTLELMTLDHTGDRGDGSPGQGFGLGFGVTTDVAASGSLGSIGQYYWSGAYCTYFFIDPKEELIAILMTQTGPYSNKYGSEMRRFVYQAIDD
ncbi:MAG: serine hydrolase domain-containing protein, partial [Bacteroidota bacterium]